MTRFPACFRLLCLFAVLSLPVVPACSGREDVLSWVDPLIGSGGHGHVFVGASVPFGMVQLGPTSIPQDWDWCSGYHASDSTVIGFSHTHLSGCGIGDLFDITVMPVTGEVSCGRGTEAEPGSGQWSYADRTKEEARPGYYRVWLERYGILAEMTATERVGFHRYTFPASADAAILFDLENGGCWDHAVDTHIEVVDSLTLCGWRHSRGWARDQKVFFYGRFSKPFTASFPKGQTERQTDQRRFGRFSFSTSEGEQVLLKVALSPTGVEGARAALEAEAPGWDFGAIRQEAEKQWREELSKIRIETSDPDVRKTFYAALYHTLIVPSLFCDRDGSYRGADGAVHPDPGYPTSTIFSLWDTYRAAMPLYTLFQPERSAGFVRTMVTSCHEQGVLPVWHLMANETWCMVGNPGAIAVADAIVKDLPGFDREEAYAACLTSVMADNRAQDLRKQYGYIPCEATVSSVAMNMEYAIADAAVAHAAAVLGKTQDEAFLTERSHSWRYNMDPETLFARGRHADGSWRTPFSPFFSHHMQDDYTEGNAWQYSWLMPHDLPLLERFYGSREKMLERLDSLFTASSSLEGAPSIDMTGMIGQYVHGNEPSHHILYFYTMAGEPGKTADLVREVMETLYAPRPDGLCGNEDAGQMSAWYIFSALGFYPVEPASTRMWFGSPLVDGASVDVGGGRTFTLKVYGNSPANRYIQAIRLDGKPYDKPWIDYGDVRRGTCLEIEMGPSPVCWYSIDN